MPLTLSCFGPFQAIWADKPINFATNATRALLAYLAVEATKPHPRELLAALLWPDQPQAAAYTNLRQTLARMRKALPDPSVLQITQQTIQLQHVASVIDVTRFEALLAKCAVHAHADLIGCTDCVERLQQATALYRGEFLHGLFLEHSQPFDEWLLFKRETLRRQALSALETLAASHEQRADYDALCDAARQQLNLELWHEPAQRKLMRGLALLGDRNAALTQYEACRRVLKEELGIEPDVETRALAERIRAGELTPAILNTSAPTHYLPAQLTPFVGRESELAELRGCLKSPF